MSLAKLTIVGNLGQDPVLRDGRDDSKFATATVAVNRGKADERTTQWFDVTVNGKLGEAFVEYCTKGDPVYLDGELTVKEKDGKTYLGIRVDNFRNMVPKTATAEA
jgi:single-strand DNA-binding protein